ncbi:MAG: hypothetical protein VKM98_01680, partial [Cyanobacteriota bacterium]|nr:hypothetical protein [Cyanobacteriota bacterium]
MKLVDQTVARCAVSVCAISTIILGTADANEAIDRKILRVTTASDPGSAFVLGPADDGRCILMTAYHVIAVNAETEPIIFSSPLGYEFKLSKGQFKFNKELDLAFTPASSCKNSIRLPVARATAITVASKVMVKGYPFDGPAETAKKPYPSTVIG